MTQAQQPRKDTIYNQGMGRREFITALNQALQMLTSYVPGICHTKVYYKNAGYGQNF